MIFLPANYVQPKTNAEKFKERVNETPMLKIIMQSKNGMDLDYNPGADDGEPPHGAED
jgi:hypothetical protein